jgi:hypothetical protein
MRVFSRSAVVPCLGLVLAACTADSGSLTPFTAPIGDLTVQADVGAQGQSHAIPLTDAGGGSGSGTVNVTPTAEGAGFTAQITVSVHGLAPNATYYVQRSPDFPVPPWTTNGVCERVDGIFPIGVPATIARWITFPIPNPGPLTAITTSAGGAGAVSFAFDLPTAAELAFDVMFRVVDNTATPAVELRTPCFTVTPN